METCCVVEPVCYVFLEASIDVDRDVCEIEIWRICPCPVDECLLVGCVLEIRDACWRCQVRKLDNLPPMLIPIATVPPLKSKRCLINETFHPPVLRKFGPGSIRGAADRWKTFARINRWYCDIQYQITWTWSPVHIPSLDIDSFRKLDHVPANPVCTGMFFVSPEFDMGIAYEFTAYGCVPKTIAPTSVGGVKPRPRFVHAPAQCTYRALIFGG